MTTGALAYLAPALRQRCAGFLVVLGLALTGCSILPVSHPQYTAQRERVVDAAYQMLGAPYRYGGATPSGFDCSGLVVFSFRQAGFAVPRTAIDQYLRSTPVANNRVEPGDLVFFTLRTKAVSHVGIYVGDGKFIHAPAFGRRVTQSRLDEPFWRSHLVRAGRLF